MKIIFTSKCEEILVDDSDYEELSRYKWHVSTTTGYACRFHGILMHRQIMRFPDEMLIDHISGNKLDNRRSNLRIATKSQNGMNRKVNLNNKLGVKGVDLFQGKYRATININLKRIHLGYFNTIEEAAEARRRAEEFYFGEFAYKE